MTTMKALKVVEKGKAEIQDAPIPMVRNDRILVKVSHVALNPTDWKHIDNMPYPGATVGCDYAGTVEEVGPEVVGEWKKGDRIAGLAHGCNQLNHEDGVFGEYALVNEGTAFKIPDNVPNEAAATLGVGAATAGLALFQKLHLPWPGSVLADVPVLIYGGSTATGSLAIQFAALSGAIVLTTCSPKNFGFVKSLGAVKAFDYNDTELSQKINEYTEDKLYYALDCIGGEEPATTLCGALSSKGGQICTIESRTEYKREDVRKKWVIAYTAMGERVRLMDKELAGMREEYALVKQIFQLTTKLLSEGKIKTHPPKIQHGLEGVLEGLEEIRQGKVSARKLVYTV